MRVVVADDDVLMREGVASLLTGQGFDVAGKAGTGPEAIELARAVKPGLVILDIRMPPTHTTEGLDVARQIRAELPGTGIVLLSAFAEVDHATELLRSGGGVGYLLKSRVTEVDEFFDALDRVGRGGWVVDPELVTELIEAPRRSHPLAGLTERERDVLNLVAEGRSNAGIAHQLFISEGTVEKHVRSILTKLGLSDSAEDHRRVLAVLRYLDAS
ncbi:response regulator transcription factor [Actinoplanes sp. Pm04-4]|uniref:Response regulator transcription factor n=1 Tax=Paractinoplanes pyxinae TaxID=2997416 RepID=A0ABT4ASD0_9ACTN|nr:response regulator transcription factor [Actinoplanes pyxinae]MCY1137134.1 response regulator transcription factor [Actinoplanes pyxinae]